MSMARLVLPSRLELKRPEGSSNEAPLAKVIFTTFLYVSPVQMIPSWYQVGTPLHFHSSTTSGSACLTSSRTRASVSPPPSPSSSILSSISSEGDFVIAQSSPSPTLPCSRSSALPLLGELTDPTLPRRSSARQAPGPRSRSRRGRLRSRSGRPARARARPSAHDPCPATA